MGCWISKSFSSREYKLIRARSVGRLLYRSLDTTKYGRDRVSSLRTHVTWGGLSLCGELGEERESTEQEALWCFYHQNHGSLHTDGCHGLLRRGEMRTMVMAEMTTHTMSAC
eukprot:scaffold77056_cov71-Attheya_sp.AAC.7